MTLLFQNSFFFSWRKKNNVNNLLNLDPLSVRKCRCVFKTFRISSTWIGRNVRPRMPVIRFALWVKYAKKARCKISIIDWRSCLLDFQRLGVDAFFKGSKKNLSYPILRVGNGFFCPITHLRNAVFYFFFLLEVRFRFEQASIAIQNIAWVISSLSLFATFSFKDFLGTNLSVHDTPLSMAHYMSTVLFLRHLSVVRGLGG